MRKVFIISILLLSFISQVYSTSRSNDEACRIASGFIATRRYQQGQVSNTPARNIRVVAESEAWKAVNIGGGFVIVGSDDSMPQVLGYSYEREFALDSINENLRYWLQCNDEEWQRVNADNLHVKEYKLQVKGENLPHEVKPLCSTTWNQTNPYNQKCPIYSGTKRSATGCVATAMAQVMARYNYPDIGVGEHTYNWVRSAGDTVELYARFDSVAYDWSLMKAETTLSIYNAQCDQLSMLMYHCGVSVDMKYGASSSASTTTAARSLVKYFGYDTGIQNIQCNILPSDSVLRILFGEIAAGRPVIISGTSEQNTRHAFIADGYNSDGYLHINWGWGGNSDGYYLMSALTPSGQQGAGSGGKTYGGNQTLIIGMQPSAENRLPASHLGIDSLTVDQTDYKNGHSYLSGLIDLSPTIKVNMVRVQNFGLYDFAGEYGLALMDMDSDSIVSVLDSRELTLRSGYFRTGTNRNYREVFSFRASSCDTGVYRLAHIYRDTDRTDWHISYARYSPSFMYISVREDSVLLSYDRPKIEVLPVDTTQGDSIVVPPDTIPLTPPDTTLTPSAIEYAMNNEIMLYPTLLGPAEPFVVYGDKTAEEVTAEIQIFDVNGEMVEERWHAELPVRQAAPSRQGLYLVRIISGKQTFVRKMVVR